MVLRDRNHPSIFCWSIGNEVIERKKLEVVTTAKKLAEHVHALDSSRPVTSALTTWDKSWEIFDPLAAVHDIVGYNYQLHRAESDHERVPSRIIMQTESYPRDAFRNWDLVTLCGLHWIIWANRVLGVSITKVTAKANIMTVTNILGMAHIVATLI